MAEHCLLGIDVSEHNGVIDWTRTKNVVQFAMLRAGYGFSVDKRFHQNAEACRKYGIPFGVYWFSYAVSEQEAEAEAETCLRTIHNYHLDYPVAFDWEDDSLRVCNNRGVKITDKILPTRMARSFLDTIKRNGYIPALYTNPAYLNRFFEYSLFEYDLWLAKWVSSESASKRSGNPPIEHGQAAKMWQFSSTGNVSGIYGNVDLNYSYVDYVEETKARMNKMTPDEVYDLLMTKLNFTKQSSWAEKEVEKAKEYGFTDGKNPYTIPSRAEVMAMINRAIDGVKLGNAFDEDEKETIANAAAIDTLNENLAKLFEILSTNFVVVPKS